MADRDELDWIVTHEPGKLKKAEQIKILKSHGITDIPKNERGRIDKIIEIIAGGD